VSDVTLLPDCPLCTTLPHKRALVRALVESVDRGVAYYALARPAGP